MTKHLVLGGARSGKSHYAEQQALQLKDSHISEFYYVATATIGDNEMQQRIEIHQNNRDECWRLIEEPLDLARVIIQYQQASQCILVDCLTLWLTNSLMQGDWPQRKSALLTALAQTQASVFFVSNEVGSGIVPLGELSRQFVDESGYLHQELAQLCDEVSVVIAGLPLALKNTKNS